MTDVRLIFAAAKGELEDAIESKYRPVADAATAAIKAAAEMLKTEGRADIGGALSRQAAQAWRVQTFPKRASSADAAVYAFSRLQNKGKEYAGVFEDGATIHGRPTLWLPLPPCPKKIGRQRMTPALYIQRIGKLRLVKRAGHKPLLVADLKLTANRGRVVGSGLIGTTATAATLRRATAKSAKGKRVTIPMFVGIDAVHIGRMTHIGRIAQQIRDRLPALYAANFKDE